MKVRISCSAKFDDWATSPKSVCWVAACVITSWYPPEPDAFVFVVPEYNHGPTPALINALDYVYHEWGFKPAAFVSYGGLSGGLRGVEATKAVLTNLNVMPIAKGVSIQWVRKHVRDGAFLPEPSHVESVQPMLDALARWAEALRPMRG